MSVRIYKDMPQGELVVNFRNFTWSKNKRKIASNIPIWYIIRICCLNTVAEMAHTHYKR